jgi:hypothetical protein
MNGLISVEESTIEWLNDTCQDLRHLCYLVGKNR